MGRTPETESLRTKALKGGVYLTVRHGAMVMLGLLGALLLTRIVGPANYGLYNAAYGVFGYLLAIGKMGVNIYLIRERRDAPQSYFIWRSGGCWGLDCCWR
jgi:Membrane protein involved in the export of O-antigen and teichoic acid